MLKLTRIIILLSTTLLFVFSVEAQTKKYRTVYTSEKTNDTWGGAKKTQWTAAISRDEKGEGPVSISIFSEDFTTVENNLTCDFEAMTSDGKAFHRVVSGMMYAAPDWTSHTGSTEINWVFLHKNIREILAEPENLPFDIEVQFEDGSAVKYFISK